MNSIGYEKGIINTFIVKNKRNRYLEFIQKPKTRNKFIDLLYHFNDLDPEVMVNIPNDQQHANNILEILKRKGAPDKCYVVSTDDEIDGRIIILSEVLSYIVGSFGGAIISCIPGRLGYYEGEHHGDRCILEKNK